MKLGIASTALPAYSAVPPMAPSAASWIPEMLELVKAVERSPSPPGNINCATYLAAVDNISKVYAAHREARPSWWRLVAPRDACRELSVLPR